MGKVLHKLFKDVVDEINSTFPNLGEPDSKVSHFIPEAKNFA